MKLADITEGETYSAAGGKAKVLAKGVPYGRQLDGVEVEWPSGRREVIRCRHVLAPWTILDERRWLARRRPA